MCMSNLVLSTSNENLTGILENSLKSKNPSIRSIALNEIWNALSRDVNRTLTDVDLVVLIIASLDSEETKDSAVAINILSKALLTTYDNTLVKSEFHQRLGKTDIIRCRVYEIAVNLGKHSETMLQKVHDVIDKALNEVENGDDVLLQMNILELMVSLAEVQHGLQYLENKKLFDKIGKRVQHQNLNRNPLDSFLIPGIMKFFGKIAYSQPESIIVGYPYMIQCLFDLILSGDLASLPTALDTLANVTGSSDGKMVVSTNYPEEHLREIFACLGGYLRTLPTDLKNRCFSALELIFQQDGKANNQISEIAEKWFFFIEESRNFEFLFSFIKNPFPEIKIACLNLIKTLSLYPWGVVGLKNTAGMIEYLLDRRVEFDKEAKQVKYELISILSETSVFDAHTILLLKKYVNEGPHYVEGILDVAVEGS
ncbi:PSMD5 family protein [Megaselia abdita]